MGVKKSNPAKGTAPAPAKVVQNKETPLQKAIPEATEVCREVAVKVFERIMRWNPIREAGTLAANLLIAEMESKDFFHEKYSLSERQAGLIKERIQALMANAANSVVLDIKDYEKNREEYIGRVVIEELLKIPEETMGAIGESINRGALLAMTAFVANAKNEDFDEITMRKSKSTGDITIPTKGIFISTNCIERIKGEIDFLKKDVKTEAAS